MTRPPVSLDSGNTGTIGRLVGTPVACPPHLEPELARALGDLHFREGRFLVMLGMIVGVMSLAVDALAIPDHLASIAAIRIGGTLPLQIAALLVPRSRIGWQKFLIGLSFCVFCASLVYASSLAPEPANAFMAIGVVALMGIAAPLLPFSRLGLAAFLLGIILPTGALLALLGSDLKFAQTYSMILVLVGLGTAVLAVRMRWLERNSALLTLQAEVRARALETSNARLTQLSMQDPLTNLANRRWAEIAFERDYALSVKEAPGYTALLLLDLDHFKDFNDRWGHDAGDKCLQAVAEVLRHAASTHGGMAARFGGEEFVVLLRTGGLSQALDIAEELRLGVERIEMVHGGSLAAISCTTSIGVAVHESEGKPQLSNLLKRADAALYEAKRDGRNRHKLAA